MQNKEGRERGGNVGGRGRRERGRVKEGEKAEGREPRSLCGVRG